MSFGEKIRELRKAKGFNQRDLAEKVGIDFTYLSKLENDRFDRPPAEETIRALARNLDANEEELILLANRIPSDWHKRIVSTPGLPEFLRAIKGRSLNKEDWAKIRKIVESKEKRTEVDK